MFYSIAVACKVFVEIPIVVSHVLVSLSLVFDCEWLVVHLFILCKVFVGIRMAQKARVGIELYPHS